MLLHVGRAADVSDRREARERGALVRHARHGERFRIRKRLRLEERLRLALACVLQRQSEGFDRPAVAEGGEARLVHRAAHGAQLLCQPLEE